MSPATRNGSAVRETFTLDLSPRAPALTLTKESRPCTAAIVGDRMRLALDAELQAARARFCARPSGARAADVANGQSTLFTQRAIANLFYREVLCFVARPRLATRSRD